MDGTHIATVATGVGAVVGGALIAYYVRDDGALGGILVAVGLGLLGYKTLPASSPVKGEPSPSGAAEATREAAS